MGTAKIQGVLWGAKPRDWAEVQEGTVLALYEAVLSRTGVGPGTALLDVGCGAGMFCQTAARRGARVSGLDATAPFIDIARTRVPDGDFRVGEMEELPFADHQFDLVTGFNSFQYAASPVDALREARRVARTGGSVVVAVWGKPEDTQASAYLAALGSCLPPPPPGSPGPFALSRDGALEELVTEAGLTPTTVAGWTPCGPMPIPRRPCADCFRQAPPCAPWSTPAHRPYGMRSCRPSHPSRPRPAVTSSATSSFISSPRRKRHGRALLRPPGRPLSRPGWS